MFPKLFRHYESIKGRETPHDFVTGAAREKCMYTS
jgi:hypothetical protein